MGKFADGMGPERMGRIRHEVLCKFLLVCALQMLVTCAIPLALLPAVAAGVLLQPFLAIWLIVVGAIGRKWLVVLLGSIPFVLWFVVLPLTIFFFDSPKFGGGNEIVLVGILNAIPTALLGGYLFRKAAFQLYAPNSIERRQVSVFHTLVAITCIAVSLGITNPILREPFKQWASTNLRMFGYWSHSDLAQFGIWSGVNLTVLAIAWMAGNLVIAKQLGRRSHQTTMAAQLSERPSS